MDSNSAHSHPADDWQQDAWQLAEMPRIQLRLAAMAGHMRLEKIATRRAALIDLLSDGCPHTREEIWQAIADRLGSDSWGKLPREGLARDLAALRKGGVRIAYSRRPGAAGYYLQYPALAGQTPRKFEASNWELIKQLRRLSVPEKNKRAFAAADFAFTQKRLILSEDYPDWSRDAVEREARRLVFGSPEG